MIYCLGLAMIVMGVLLLSKVQTKSKVE
jgi:hypothetical protein